jgi:dsRNA-specific ribonuclease
VVEVHAGVLRLEGQGSSRREAEQEAARSAMRRLDEDGARPLPEVHLEP